MNGYLSIDQFCTENAITRSQYYVLRGKGTGPEEHKAGKLWRISREAADKWRKAQKVKR
jgi:hypothetical protein